MDKIILPIRPEYAERILDGTKCFEYRKTLAKNVGSILLYATAPVKKVVGEVKVIALLHARPEDMWADTSDSSGITKDYFDEYFSGEEMAHAYILGESARFAEPKSLSEYGINYTPQSFVYIRGER